MTGAALMSSFAQAAPKTNASTPPERRGLLLLTPPASTERHVRSELSVEGFVRTIEGYRDSPPVTQPAPIKIPPGHFNQLSAALRSKPSLRPYVEDKLRLDYDAISGTLLVRMPTPIHDFFSASVADEIHEKLKRIAARDDAPGKFADDIRKGGSSRIILQEEDAKPVSQRHPDGQFQHRRAAYPGVVLEVSYSQDGKDLKKLAWQYIQLSNGDIKAVIGIDVNNAPNPSTVSLWRPNYVRDAGEDVLDVKQEVNSQPFQSSSGAPMNPTQELRLVLSDFATDELCDGLEAAELHITYARLAELLVQAQEMQTAREHVKDGGVRSSRKNKRRLPSSSPDRLLSEDETQFRFDEERAAEEATAADDDFRLPSKKKRS